MEYKFNILFPLPWHFWHYWHFGGAECANNAIDKQIRQKKRTKITAIQTKNFVYLAVSQYLKSKILS